MSLSLLSDPFWTAGAYSVQFDYFTDNFVPCSISFESFDVFFPSHCSVVFLLFFHIYTPPDLLLLLAFGG